MERPVPTDSRRLVCLVGGTDGLVGVGLRVVLVLIELVADGVLRGRSAVPSVSGNPSFIGILLGLSGKGLPSGDGVVPVLGDVFVGLLGGLGGGGVEALLDVVGGLLRGVHFDCGCFGGCFWVCCGVCVCGVVFVVSSVCVVMRLEIVSSSKAGLLI